MRRIFVVFILTVALCLGLIPAGGGVFAAETQDTASDTGFVINKVDDDEVPVEGAVFDIYGKPEVSWEEIKKPDPEPCELDPPVEKIITGDTELIGGGVLPEFSFTLKAAYPSYPMPGGHEGDEMHATVNGEGPVEFGFITFTEAGTYEYTVSEDPHGEENYSVDENVYTITYVIEEVDGKLQGVRTFFKKGEVQEAIEKIVFENVYTAPVPEETTSVTVTKVWDDDENRDGKRPDKVTVGLRADGGNTGRSAELSAANDWTYTWEGLPKQENGADISYTVTENETEGYVADVTGDAASGFTITNSYSPETTYVSGIKIWDDADDQDGKRPANVTVRLHADGIEKDMKTVSPDASGNWNYSFENLPKYKDGGIEIKYTVTEDATEGYQPSYTPLEVGV